MGGAGFIVGCAGGIFFQVWAQRLGRPAGRLVLSWMCVTVRGALHKGFEIPKFVDLLRANGFNVRLRYSFR